jgi:hypothetical protein
MPTKPKKVKKVHNYGAWNKVLQDEQKKNAERIQEVERKYKVTLIKELIQKEKTYQTVKSLRESLVQKAEMPRSESANQGQGGSVSAKMPN